MKPVLKLFFLFLFVAVSGCDFFIKKNDHEKVTEERQPLARVYSEYLYPKDLEGLGLEKLHGQDSADFMAAFLKNWIKKRLLIQRAGSMMIDNLEEIESKVAEYRHALLTHEYEKKYLRERLDSIITDAEIQNFYESNQGNFELKQNIIRGYFIKVPKDAPKIDKVKDLINSDRKKDMKELKSYCLRYANSYSLDDTTWMNLEDLMKNSPFINIQNKVQFLETKRYAEESDGTYMYFIRIKDYKITDQLSPLGFVKNQIKNILINQRKVRLIEELEETLFKQAQEENDFEIYKK